MSYDTAFYDVIRQGCLTSARAAVPIILGHLPKINTVVDVGCGEGLWASAFAEHGCEVTGVDGDYVDRERLAIPADRFVPLDLAAQPLTGLGTFDLAVSLEVAEHLPETRAASFIAELCELAPVVVFSAAIPGQAGNGHINERWPTYWDGLFKAAGMSTGWALRFEFWSNPQIECWYQQNTMLAVRADHPAAGSPLFDGPATEPHHIVHPAFWKTRTGYE